MSAANRLQGVQSALEQRGVRDVKFCFSLNMAEKPGSEVAVSVAGFLDAYLKGRYREVERIGDSVLTKT